VLISCSAPHKGFLKESPELNVIEVPTPFKVGSVKGLIVYGGGTQEKPVAGATFEVRDSSGRIRSVTTNDSGEFAIPNMPPGTYDFKVTRNGFQSTIGRVVVSGRSSPNRTMKIELQIGA
jgi:hypothetical protein